MGLPSVRVIVSAGIETSATLPSCPTVTAATVWPRAVDAGTMTMFDIWSRLVRYPVTWRGIVPVPCLSEPTDCTTAACCRADATWARLTRCAASLIGSSVTSTSSVGAPVITSEETPARPFSFGSAWVRSWPARSPSGSSADTAYVRIGMLLVENVCTVEAGA